MPLRSRWSACLLDTQHTWVVRHGHAEPAARTWLSDQATTSLRPGAFTRSSHILRVSNRFDKSIRDTCFPHAPAAPSAVPRPTWLEAPCPCRSTALKLPSSAEGATHHFPPGACDAAVSPNTARRATSSISDIGISGGIRSASIRIASYPSQIHYHRCPANARSRRLHARVRIHLALLVRAVAATNAAHDPALDRVRRGRVVAGAILQSYALAEKRWPLVEVLPCPARTHRRQQPRTSPARPAAGAAHRAAKSRQSDRWRRLARRRRRFARPSGTWS